MTKKNCIANRIFSFHRLRKYGCREGVCDPIKYLQILMVLKGIFLEIKMSHARIKCFFSLIFSLSLYTHDMIYDMGYYKIIGLQLIIYIILFKFFAWYCQQFRYKSIVKVFILLVKSAFNMDENGSQTCNLFRSQATKQHRTQMTYLLAMDMNCQENN